MPRTSLRLHLAALCALSLTPATPAIPAAPIQDDATLEQRMLAVESLVQSSGDEALELFLDEQIADSLKEALSKEDLLSHLRDVRGRCRNFGGIMAEALEDGPGLVLTFDTARGWFELEVRLEEQSPFRIADLPVRSVAAPAEPELLPLTWNELDAQLDAFEREADYRGSLLIVRPGQPAYTRHFGHVDAAGERPVDADTAFAVGSMPIDFTRAAILKLQDQGRLKLEDPITEFLDDVPADKRGIRLSHLMSGSSGLRNFHGVRGVDHDMDLAWIDRETALARILSLELLFEPGRGRAHSHSHSAFGVLAAIVEIVSDRSYGEFVSEELLRPAGMTRTGLYEETAPFAADVAMGTPAELHGKPNSPLEWGPTSWLVMGSGGMVSNPRDLARYIQALRGGKLLSPEALASYWTSGEGLAEGGNDRGFLCSYNEGPGTMMFLCSSSHTGPGDDAGLLARSVYELIRRGPAGEGGGGGGN